MAERISGFLVRTLSLSNTDDDILFRFLRDGGGAGLVCAMKLGLCWIGPHDMSNGGNENLFPNVQTGARRGFDGGTHVAAANENDDDDDDDADSWELEDTKLSCVYSVTSSSILSSIMTGCCFLNVGGGGRGGRGGRGGNSRRVVCVKNPLGSWYGWSISMDARNTESGGENALEDR